MLLKLAISLTLMFSSVSWADCPEAVSVINKGDKAVCDGILLSPEASKKADEAVQDAKYYKMLSEKLIERQQYTDKEINILDKRLKLYMEESNTLATQLVHKDNADKWQKIVYFGLGVVVTGLAVYGAAQIR
jgi:hypothetical protein